ncbi:hypothetical protein PR048_020844 [Dryococelus australis]|uniref:Uncharacterized protein n=1 Tax=Dryococelus australis TaxID=614101 RepID=A0ABQ9GWN0_9NEOP|nr:hypothetical protein PR048_020844 [Dryococelus australis]
MSKYNTSLRRTVKWYHKLTVELLFGITLLNSQIIYDLCSTNKLSINAFKEEIVKELLKKPTEIEVRENWPSTSRCRSLQSHRFDKCASTAKDVTLSAPREKHKKTKHFPTGILVRYGSRWHSHRAGLPMTRGDRLSLCYGFRDHNACSGGSILLDSVIGIVEFTRDPPHLGMMIISPPYIYHQTLHIASL